MGGPLWALGAIVGRAGDPGSQSLAGDLFHAASPAVTTFTSSASLGLRAPWASTSLFESLPGRQHGRSTRRDEIADRLLGLFERTSRPDWPWFEDSVTYCNSRLSQALIVSGDRMDRSDMLDAGMRSLDWLIFPCDRLPTDSSRPSDPAGSTNAGHRRRSSISSRSKRPRWCLRASTRGTACTTTGGG